MKQLIAILSILIITFASCTKGLEDGQVQKTEKVYIQVTSTSADGVTTNSEIITINK